MCSVRLCELSKGANLHLEFTHGKPEAGPARSWQVVHEGGECGAEGRGTARTVHDHLGRAESGVHVVRRVWSQSHRLCQRYDVPPQWTP